MDKNIDFIICGEGEERLPTLLKSLEDNGNFDKVDGLSFRRGKALISNPIQSRVKDLDELPFPHYDIFDMEKYMYYPLKNLSEFGTANEVKMLFN